MQERQSVRLFTSPLMNWPKKLVDETQTANKRSYRLLEKLGMQLERKVIRFGAEQAMYSISSPLNTEFQWRV